MNYRPLNGRAHHYYYTHSSYQQLELQKHFSWDFFLLFCFLFVMKRNRAWTLARGIIKVKSSSCKNGITKLVVVSSLACQSGLGPAHF